MTSLSRRLQRLEAGCRQNDGLVADRCRFVRQNALHHLTVDELRCLVEAYEAGRDDREWTSQELAAASALSTALDLECQKAGMTRAEFNRFNRAHIQAGQ
jgi:hypothetical protein